MLFSLSFPSIAAHRVADYSSTLNSNSSTGKPSAVVIETLPIVVLEPVRQSHTHSLALEAVVFAIAFRLKVTVDPVILSPPAPGEHAEILVFDATSLVTSQTEVKGGLLHIRVAAQVLCDPMLAQLTAPLLQPASAGV